MMEVIVSRLASNGLIHIQSELSNPDAALLIMTQLKQAMKSLPPMW